jgi:hypothetical protein
MQDGESSMAAETAVIALFSGDFQDWVVYREPIAIDAPDPIAIYSHSVTCQSVVSTKNRCPDTPIRKEA